MSRPRYAWYGEIKRRIAEGKWNNPQSFQDYVLMKAVYDAKKDTRKLPNGKERLEAIELILIQGTSYTEAEFKLYQSRPTLQRWTTSFVNLVGKKAGY